MQINSAQTEYNNRLPPQIQKQQRNIQAGMINAENRVFADPMNPEKQKNYLRRLIGHCHHNKFDSYDLAFLLMLIQFGHLGQSKELIKPHLPTKFELLDPNLFRNIDEESLAQLSSALPPQILLHLLQTKSVQSSLDLLRLLIIFAISNGSKESGAALVSGIRTVVFSSVNAVPSLLDDTLTKLFWAEILLLLDPKINPQELYSHIQSYEPETPSEERQKGMLEWVLWARFAETEAQPPASDFPFNIPQLSRENLKGFDVEDCCRIVYLYASYTEDKSEKQSALKMCLLLRGNALNAAEKYIESRDPFELRVELKDGIQDVIFNYFVRYLAPSTKKFKFHFGIKLPPDNMRSCDLRHLKQLYTFGLFAKLSGEGEESKNIDSSLTALRVKLFCQTIPHIIFHSLLARHPEPFYSFPNHVLNMCKRDIEV